MDVADAVDRARRLLDEDKADEALEILLAAARENPCEDLDLEIASVYTERGFGRTGEPALADFAEARTWAELPLTLVGEAQVRILREELEQAEALLAQALEMDPELPPAKVLEGRIRLYRGNLAGAGEAFMTAVQLSPQYGDAYLGLAEALTRAERRKEAIEALAEGARQDPGNDVLLVAFAEALTGEKEYERARTAWRRATEINRFNAAAWRGLAAALARDGDETGSAQALSRAEQS